MNDKGSSVSFSSNRDETDRIEKILLDWLLVSFVFFVAGVMLGDVTSYGHIFALFAFAITIYLLIITIVDYSSERKRLIEQGIQPTARSDLLAVGAILSIILTLWIMIRILREKIIY